MVRKSQIDVFISYCRADAQLAEEAQAIFERAGLVVWRDPRLNDPDADLDFTAEIQAAIQRAGRVVVIWTTASLQSRWVLAEALLGFSLGKSIGLLQPGLAPPFPHNAHHAMGLPEFRADPEKLLEKLGAALSPDAKAWRLSPPRASLSRLRDDFPVLFGRDRDLDQLRAATANPQTRLVFVTGPAGVGKTAAIGRFLRDTAPTAQTEVFAWDFASADGDAGPDFFLAEASAFWGVADGPAHNPHARAERLARALADSRGMMVLDGLEALYVAGPAGGGVIGDPGVRALLQAVSAARAGQILAAASALPAAFAGAPEPIAARVDLKPLSMDAAQDLLRHVGCAVGPLSAFETIAVACAGLPGPLVDIGRQIAAFEQGDARRFDRAAAFATGDGEPIVRRLEALGDSAALAALRVLAVIGAPAPFEVIAALVRPPEIVGLTQGMHHWSRREWAQALHTLQTFGWASPSAAPDLEGARIVPAVAASIRAQLRRDQPAALREGHHRLYDFFKRRDLDPLFSDPHAYAMAALVAGAAGEVAGVRSEIAAALGRRRWPASWRDALPEALKAPDWRAARVAFRALEKMGLEATVARFAPASLAAAAPLLAALGHAREAGRADLALSEVYWPRLLRGNRAHLTRTLGGHSVDLAALATFFVAPFETPAPELDAWDQALVLNFAGTALRANGRLLEARAPLERSYSLAVGEGSMDDAAVAAGALCEIHLALGEMAAAQTWGDQALQDARAGGSDLHVASQMTKLAAVRRLGGDLDGARRDLDAAEALVFRPGRGALSSLEGVRRVQVLFEQGATRTAAEAARQGLAAAQAEARLLDRGLFELALAQLAAAPLAGVEAALAVLQEAGEQEGVTQGLLAWLRHAPADHPARAARAAALQDIVDASALRVAQVEHLILAASRAAAAGDVAAAAASLDRAEAEIAALGLDHFAPESAMARAECALATGAPDAAARLDAALTAIERTGAFWLVPRAQCAAARYGGAAAQRASKLAARAAAADAAPAKARTTKNISLLKWLSMFLRRG